MDALEPARRFWLGLVPLALWLAYFIQPVLRFSDIDALAGAAMLMGNAALLVWMRAPFEKKLDIAGGLVGAALFCWGSYVLLDAAFHIGPDVRANDRRCLAIQRDMLSAHPRRPDGPDLFQSLGCRPQGGDSVYAPKPVTIGSGWRFAQDYRVGKLRVSGKTPSELPSR